jgi:flagellar protein FlbD
MIKLTRINNQTFVLNSDLIEYVEATPDTVITLVTGQKLMVHESADEVTQSVISFRRATLERICVFPSAGNPPRVLVPPEK